MLCSSGSDDEDVDGAGVVGLNVKVKEEPVSEDDETPLFKRSSKLKAQLILSRYNQTGGDANVEGDDYIPDIIRREEDDAVQSFHAENLSSTDNLNSNSNNHNLVNLDEPLNIDVRGDGQSDDITLPLTVAANNCNGKNNHKTKHKTERNNGNDIQTDVLSPRSRGKSKRRSRSRRSSASSTTSSCSSTSNTTTQKSRRNEPEPPPPCDMFEYATNNADHAVPVECKDPILCIVQEDIQRMVARVVHLLKQLIEHLKLPHTSVQGYIQPLLMKSCVVAIRESYTGCQHEASFLEKQIKDFTQIVLRELPLDRLALLLKTFTPPVEADSSSLQSTTTAKSIEMDVPEVIPHTSKGIVTDSTHSSLSSNNINSTMPTNNSDNDYRFKNSNNSLSEINTSSDVDHRAVRLDDSNNHNTGAGNSISISSCDLSIKKSENKARKSVVNKKPSQHKPLVRQLSSDKSLLNEMDGPHRFYKTPKKRAKNSVIGEVCIPTNTDDQDFRYKDRVNKIFAAKLAASKVTTNNNIETKMTKVVDLTNSAVEDSVSEDVKDNESENCSSE